MDEELPDSTFSQHQGQCRPLTVGQLVFGAAAGAALGLL